MTPEAKQLLKDKPELCKEIFVAAFKVWDRNPDTYGLEDYKGAFDDLVKKHTEQQDWEILSFNSRHYGVIPYKDGRVYYNDGSSCDLHEMLERVKAKVCSIHSVRRLSDNEVFGKRDWVIENATGTNAKWQINEFSIKDTRMFAEGVNINYLTKLTPLFTTEDGVDLFEGDKYWFVCEDMGIYYHEVYTSSQFKKEGNTRFSTRSAAEQWVEDNKPVFSKAQLKRYGLLEDTINNIKNS